MLLELVIHQGPWIPLAVWIALYVSDYAMTLKAARLYHDHVKEHIVFEGSYELTPYYEKDIDGLKKLSPRFLGALALSSALLVVLWYLSRLLDAFEPFSLAFGAMVLLEAAVYLRHLRNRSLFKNMIDKGGLTGQTRYSRWLILSNSASELFAFAGLFLLLAILLGSFFLLGGALSCLATGARHRQMGKKLEAATAG